jgi:hypothetical protein
MKQTAIARQADNAVAARIEADTGRYPFPRAFGCSSAATSVIRQKSARKVGGSPSQPLTKYN